MCYLQYHWANFESAVLFIRRTVRAHHADGRRLAIATSTKALADQLKGFFPG
jgi:hypothetical protein